MSFRKIPHHLQYSIEEILADARKKISIQYIYGQSVKSNKKIGRSSPGCQISDNNDYSVYFYEPKRFQMLPPRNIKSIHQQSAHQNAIIALANWEKEVREFLTNPEKSTGENSYKTTETQPPIGRLVSV